MYVARSLMFAIAASEYYSLLCAFSDEWVKWAMMPHVYLGRLLTDVNSNRNYVLNVKYACWRFSCITFSSFIENINLRTVLFRAVTH
jgi:hypothetical protein